MNALKNFYETGLVTFLVVIPALLADATVVTYPAPDGAKLNKAFGVEVRQSGDTEWRPVDVYAVKVDKTEGVKHSAATVSMAYMSQAARYLMVMLRLRKRMV